ncbi:MAG: uroporphyrinogen decarboxylase family protein [Thermodesulfobacteriota bacterium]
MIPLSKMSSMERVLTTLGHNEPDRVPFFLLLSLHGARELGMTIREYFSRPDNVVEGQLRMLAKYNHDCLYPFFYASIEVEAFGGETIFYDDGPPNCGAPIIRLQSDIGELRVPEIEKSAGLARVLTAITALKEKVGDETPIIAVAVSPFSLPVMQMGFAQYFELIYESPELFDRLMAVNEEFCVSWANAQLNAGATAICYFDPLASPTMISREMYLKTGFEVSRRTLARINGPTATHLASGHCLPIVDDLTATGTAAVGVSALEDLSEIKEACRNKLTVIGNLNGVEMRSWTVAQAEQKVKDAINGAAAGGGFILSDNHGEIPWQVDEEVLLAISRAVRQWGNYPVGKKI